MGQIFSKSGVESNREYVAEKNDMPCTNNIKDLLRFLGIVKLVAKFIANGHVIYDYSSFKTVD